MGRIIAAVTMFAAIGFLWTFVELVGSSLVTRKVREANKQQQKEEQLQPRLLQRTLPKPTVANETKELLKNKIEILDLLDDKDLEDLIKLIRMINSERRSKLADVVVQQKQTRRTTL